MKRSSSGKKDSIASENNGSNNASKKKDNECMNLAIGIKRETAWKPSVANIVSDLFPLV
jgi:hypothetical protein